jgi:AcrR family transcriptional regulator
VTAKSKTKSRLKGAERQEQILQAAIEVFSQNGFRGTTLRQLAHRAGVSEAMIYYHFPSKEALYDAILKKKIEASRHLFFPEQAGRMQRDQEVFRTVVGNFLQQHAQDDTFMRMLLFSALEGHDLAQKFVRGPMREFYSFLGCYLEGRMRQNDFKTIDGQVAARLLMGMVIYFTLLREIFEDPVIQEIDLTELTKTIVDLFCRGIQQPGSAPHGKVEPLDLAHE